MITSATTPTALAAYLEDYLRQHGASAPALAFTGVTADQVQMIIEALRRPGSRTTAQG